MEHCSPFRFSYHLQRIWMRQLNAAKAAFPGWSKTPIKERVQVFFRYKYLLEKNLQELAALISEENGKTIAEAIAEIEKCIELTEFACSLPQLVTGEVLEVSKGVECRTEHVAAWCCCIYCSI